MASLLNILAIAGGLVSMVIAAPAFAQTRDLAAEEANRKLVVEFYDRFFNKHETIQAAEVVADDYIQHNPQSRARVVRSATDGDLVWLHIHSTNGKDDRGRAVVDIFRVENGKLAEHWDVIQSVPENAANNNTMF